VAVCTALGSAFGYAYLQLLMRDVDAFGQDDATAAAFLMQEDSSLELAALRHVIFIDLHEIARFFEPLHSTWQPQPFE